MAEMKIMVSERKMGRGARFVMEDRKDCASPVGGMPCGKWADKVLYTYRSGQRQMITLCATHAAKVMADYPGEFSETPQLDKKGPFGYTIHAQAVVLAPTWSTQLSLAIASAAVTPPLARLTARGAIFSSHDQG